MVPRVPLTAALFLTIVLSAVTAAAQTDPFVGTWIGGENGESDLEVHLVVGADLQGTVARLGQTTPRPPVAIQVARLAPNFYRALVVGEEDVLYFLVQSPNRVLGFEAGDDDLGVFYRVAGAPPAGVLGDWHAIHPRSGEPQFGLTLTATQAVLTNDEGRVEGPLWTIASDGSMLQLAFNVNTGGEPHVFNLQPHPEGGFIAWELGRDDFVLLQRPGTVPSWMTGR